MSERLQPTEAFMRALFKFLRLRAPELDAHAIDHFPELSRQVVSTNGFLEKENHFLLKADLAKSLSIFKKDEQYGALTAKFIEENYHKLVVKEAQRRGRCPFPGLGYFRPEQENLFKGREADLQRVQNLLTAKAGRLQAWLRIDGDSGIGKSSFIRAALSPALNRGLITTIGNRIPCLTAVMRPGNAPVRALAKALTTTMPGPAGSGIPWEYALSSLDREDGLRDILTAHLPEDLHFVLIVDQFEELLLHEGFLAQADQQRTATTTPIEPVPALDSARRFLIQLSRAIGDSDLRFSLITVTRTDRLTTTNSLPGLDAFLSSSSEYHLKPLTEEDLHSALEHLVAQENLKWEEGLLKKVVDAYGARPHILPLIGHMLASLWHRPRLGMLTHVEYEAAGGLTGALGLSADRLWASLDSNEQSRAQRLIYSMIKIGRGTANVRRPVPRQEALATLGAPSPESLLDILCGHGLSGEQTMPLLVISPNDERKEQHRVDLIHEELLASWALLSNWLKTDSKLLERDDDLEAIALTWELAREAGSVRDDALPGASLLDYYEGLDLSGADRRRLRTLASPRAQRFLGEARRVVTQRERRQKTVRRMLIGLSGLLLVAVSLAWLQTRAKNKAVNHALKESRAKNTAVTKALGCVERLARAYSEEEWQQPREIALAADELLQALNDVDVQDPKIDLLRYRAIIIRGDDASVNEKIDGLDEAMAQYKKAQELSEKMLANDPGNEIIRVRLALSLRKQGKIWTRKHKFDYAIRSSDEEIKHLSIANSSKPNDVYILNHLGICHGQRAQRFAKLSKTSETKAEAEAASRYFQQVIDLCNVNPREDRCQAEYMIGYYDNISVNYGTIGDILSNGNNASQLDRAYGYYDKSREILEKQIIPHARTDMIRYKNGISIAYSNFGDIEFKRGNFDKAIENYNKAIDVGNETLMNLGEIYPKTQEVYQNLIEIHISLADTLFGKLAKDGSESLAQKIEAAYLAAKEQARKLDRGSTDHAEIYPYYIRSDLGMAALHQRLGRCSEARKFLNAARKRLTELLRDRSSAEDNEINDMETKAATLEHSLVCEADRQPKMLVPQESSRAQSAGPR